MVKQLSSNGDDLAANVFVKVPATLGGMYVPKSVMDLVWPKGDNFFFQSTGNWT